jgi:hypothetical protein
MADFQRVGSESNAHVGREFEDMAVAALGESGIDADKNFSVDVGVSGVKKAHRFDLGSESPPVLVECKAHPWTAGGNVPSAKLTVWNEAMYYFACAPSEYRKILFVLRDVRAKTGETLAEYYIRIYRHLIPPDVEIWEFDQGQRKFETLSGRSQS